MSQSQRPVYTFHVTKTGPTHYIKWSGMAATFYFDGDFAGNVITAEISPDSKTWYDPSDNDFTQKTARTLIVGAGEFIRLNAAGGATPNVFCQIAGETTQARG